MKSDLAVSDLAVCGGGLEFWTPRKGSAPWSSAMTWAVIKTWGRLGLIREKTTTFSVDGQVPHDCSRTIQIVESPDFGLDGSRTVNNAFF